MGANKNLKIIARVGIGYAQMMKYAYLRCGAICRQLLTIIIILYS